MLKKAGFEEVDISLSVLNYYNPFLVVKLDKKSQIRHFKEFSINKSKNILLKKLAKLLLCLGLLGYFEHSLYISAIKQP